MRSRRVLAAASAALIGALALGVGMRSALSNPAGKTVTCTIRLKQQTSLAKPSGYDLGFVTCPAPFGRGLYYDHFRDATRPPSTVIAKGPFKYFFNAGAVHGTYRITGTATGLAATFSGSVRFAGGTGAFRHVAGSGKLTCKTRDGGLHGKCAAVVKLTYV